MAHWFLACAWDKRGHSNANLVSDQGWRGLHYFLAQAEGGARHATALAANPLAAWVTVGRTELARGCSLTPEDVQAARYPDWFTEGLKDNPHSLELRRTMLMSLRTEWGGSEEQMLTFVRQQESAGLSSADMQRLWAQLHQQVSHHAHAFANNPRLAVERAELAANLRELESGQLLVALTNADSSPLERRAALDRYLSAIEREPDAEPNANLYWALYNASEWLEPLLPRVIGMLQAQIALGNDEAAVALGTLKIINRKWELPDPLPALSAARDAGNREAAETIVALQEVGLGLRAALKTTPGKTR